MPAVNLPSVTINLQTYQSLADGILSWCNQSADAKEFIALIPTFITLTEQQLFMDMSTLGNLYPIPSSPGGAALQLSAGVPFLRIPQNSLWGRTLSISLLNDTSKPYDTENRVLERITLERMNEYQQTLPKNASSQAIEDSWGMPQFYTDYSFGAPIVYPIPDQNYPYQLIIYQKITPLSSTAGLTTNWNTENNYDTLFYGCLAKAFAYLHNTDDSTFYDGLYKERVAAYLAYDKNRLVDRNINATGFNDVF